MVSSKSQLAKITAELDSAELRRHAEQVGRQLSEARIEATQQAAAATEAAKDWATPRVEAAIEWVTPKVTRLWQRGARAAAPKIESAAKIVTPVIDDAHEKIVDDLIPWIVAAAADAAAGAVAVQEEATKRTHEAAKRTKDAALVLKGDAVVTQKKKGKAGKVFLWLGVGAAVIGAGYYAWQRTRPIDDPWADDDDWADFADETVEKVVDAAEQTREAAIATPPVASAPPATPAAKKAPAKKAAKAAEPAKEASSNDGETK